MTHLFYNIIKQVKKSYWNIGIGGKGGVERLGTCKVFEERKMRQKFYMSHFIRLRLHVLNTRFCVNFISFPYQSVIFAFLHHYGLSFLQTTTFLAMTVNIYNIVFLTLMLRFGIFINFIMFSYLKIVDRIVSIK